MTDVEREFFRQVERLSRALHAKAEMLLSDCRDGDGRVIQDELEMKQAVTADLDALAHLVRAKKDGDQQDSESP